MSIIALRGAVTAKDNSIKSIDEATLLLMNTIIKENNLCEDDIIHILFTATSDLTTRYPSVVVRNVLGWHQTAMLNFEEKIIVDQLPRCIRVLLLIETDRPKTSFRHSYLGEASKLRPDWIIE